MSRSLYLLFYSLGIRLYYLAALVASLFNAKARQWIQGRNESFRKLRAAPAGDYVWFHCASLGEFEQGRPLLERIKQEYPDTKIALSFYSPSGYEVRKDYPQADVIFYLPLDTKSNAQKVLDLLKPKLTVFVRYEFWYNYLEEMRKRETPLLLVSGSFRKEQPFFNDIHKRFWQHMLWCFTKLYVRDIHSQLLLDKIGVSSEVAPDTRFDRVHAIAQEAKSFPTVEQFLQGKKAIVAGSTWPPDEQKLAAVIRDERWADYKFIIAPHNIQEPLIQELERLLPGKTVRYSRFKEEHAKKQVLIIDNIGMLSSLYRYAHIAYVGGGFGKSVHNILEAAVYGIPIMYGPNHDKALEAIEMKEDGSGILIYNAKDIEEVLLKCENEAVYQQLCSQSRSYVQQHLGGTNIIMQHIRQAGYLH